MIRSFIAPALALALATGPAAAEEPSQKLEELKRSFDDTFGELMDHLGPQLDSIGRTFDTLGSVDSLGYYEQPEILPNGDILLRRREDAPAWVPPRAEETPGAPPAEQLPPDDGSGIRL